MVPHEGGDYKPPFHFAATQMQTLGDWSWSWSRKAQISATSLSKRSTLFMSSNIVMRFSSSAIRFLKEPVCSASFCHIFFQSPSAGGLNSVEVFFPDLFAGGGGMFRQLEFKNGYI